MNKRKASEMLEESEPEDNIHKALKVEGKTHNFQSFVGRNLWTFDKIHRQLYQAIWPICFKSS